MPKQFSVYEGAKCHIKAWDSGLPIEGTAMNQLYDLAKLPFVRGISVMPDCHAGYGSTVGSVIVTDSVVMPSTVGVDIGCGMVAARLNLSKEDLPDDLSGIRSEIEACVPHGRTNNGRPGDRGAWEEPPEFVEKAWATPKMVLAWDALVKKYPQLARNATPEQHLGTLGSGNHFIEICLDEEDRVWIMLHSGSRGPGNRIGQLFTRKAQAEMERWYIDYLPIRDLAFLPRGTELFDDYMEAVLWAQGYARVNRELMLRQTLVALRRRQPDAELADEIINCHHNYIARENHLGRNVFVTRKGAVRARENDLGIIPGSMGAKSYIVQGKQNAASFHSCSHGAGRTMSRTRAKATFSLEDHAAATKGVECRKDVDVLDETPAAYKNIEDVMAAQEDLVKIVHELHQVICVKG